MWVSADRLVTGRDVLRDGWLHVHDGRIAAIGTGPAPAPTAHAAVLVPGFVDMHVHGGGGGGFPTADPAQIAAAVALHRRHGTTTMLGSLVTATPDDLLHQVAVLADAVEAGDLAGIHLEGPWLAAAQHGAHPVALLRDPDSDEWQALREAGRGTIRMVTVAPERQGALGFIIEIVADGVVAAVGHTDAGYDRTCAAIAAGATVGTHLFNAMRSVHHREPGPVIALMEDPRVTVELIADGVHLHPALYRDVARTVGTDRVALVTDAMAAAGMSDGAYVLGSLQVEVVDGVARVAGTGTIAGSTATMDVIFRHAVAGSGPDREAALLTAARQTSMVPAAAVALPSPELVVGAPADLVLLDGSLRVENVLRHGHVVPRD